MTRDRAKQLLPVIQAYAEGKTIQCHNCGWPEGQWGITENPSWDESLDYRVKPEPREFWIVVNGPGAVPEMRVELAPPRGIRNHQKLIHVREVL